NSRKIVSDSDRKTVARQSVIMYDYDLRRHVRTPIEKQSLAVSHAVGTFD
ncbi:hypothetical protein BaRGS_00029744, partial [Batillaria attramentaria]